MAEAFVPRSEADENQQLLVQLDSWKPAKEQPTTAKPELRRVDIRIIGSRALQPLEYGDDGNVYYDC